MACRLTQMTMTGTTAQTKIYSYDAIGNLTFRSDVGTLTYPAVRAARPHAVTSIAGNASGVIDGVSVVRRVAPALHFRFAAARLMAETPHGPRPAPG